MYSFGVLLLELLTGKEPTHDPSYGTALHIVAWIRNIVQLNEGQMNPTILDPSLLYEKDEDKSNLAYVKQMLQVQVVALMCTEKNPTDRPQMRDVGNMLQALSSPMEKNNMGNNPLVGLVFAKEKEGRDQVLQAMQGQPSVLE